MWSMWKNFQGQSLKVCLRRQYHMDHMIWHIWHGMSHGPYNSVLSGTLNRLKLDLKIIIRFILVWNPSNVIFVELHFDFYRSSWIWQLHWHHSLEYHLFNSLVKTKIQHWKGYEKAQIDTFGGEATQMPSAKLWKVVYKKSSSERSSE